FRRSDDLQSDVFVAAPAAPEVESLAAQPQPLAALRARRDGHLDRAIERRNVDARAERRLPRRHRQIDLNITFWSDTEEVVRLQPQSQQKVAGGRVPHSRLPLSRQSNHRTFAHARRDVDIERLGTPHNTRAPARRAGLVVYGARAIARGAWRRGLNRNRSR